MIISTLSNIDYVDSTGISEKYEIYRYSNIVPPAPLFKNGDILVCGYGVFERIGDDLQLQEVDGDPSSLNVGDIYLDTSDSYIKYVTTKNGEEAAKQPEAYANVDTSLDSSTWANRYVKLGNLGANNVWSGTINGITHTLYNTNGQWRYKLTRPENVQYWADIPYDAGNNLYCRSWAGKAYTTITYQGNHAATHTIQDRPLPVQYGTIISDDYGHTYRCGRLVTQSGGEYWYAIQLLSWRTQNTVIVDVPIDMRSQSVINVSENSVYCVNSSNCAIYWVPNTIINRNGVLYARTGKPVPMETYVPTINEGTILDCLDKIDWGWKWKEPSQKLLPFDGKSHTVTIQNQEIEFTVKVENVNVLAISNLIASSVTVTLIGTGETLSIQVDNSIANNNISPLQGLTKIIYSGDDIYTGDITLNFKPANGLVQIGEIVSGVKIEAGFTNLRFSNKFNDYSPYEKDQWGNITRIEGIKTNVFNGTVDIELYDYDRINRLMKYIGGRKIILDGSDNVENETNDNENFFASTQLVGRIGNFALDTKLDNDVLSQIASYSFTIEEEV